MSATLLLGPHPSAEHAHWHSDTYIATSHYNINLHDAILQCYCPTPFPHDAITCMSPHPCCSHTAGSPSLSPCTLTPLAADPLRPGGPHRGPAPGGQGMSCDITCTPKQAMVIIEFVRPTTTVITEKFCKRKFQDLGQNQPSCLGDNNSLSRISSSCEVSALLQVKIL